MSNHSGNLISLAVLIEEAGAIVLGKEVLLKLFVQIAKKNVKFLSVPQETVRYIARSASANIKKAAARLSPGLNMAPAREALVNSVVLVNPQTEKAAGPAVGKNQVFAVEKNAFKRTSK